MRNAVCLVSLIVLVSCSSGKDAEVGPSASAEPAESASQASAAPIDARPVEVVEKNALYEFEYSFPAQAAAIPALKTKLDAELAKARVFIASEAKAAKADSKDSGFEYIPYASSMDWSAVTETPGWLSLFGRSYLFTGGAHGNPATEALLWDKDSGSQRDALDLFVSKAAFDAAVRSAFCAALNRERSKRREAPVPPDSEDEFDLCPTPSDLTILLGSGDNARFTRIGIIADPYVAGPYAEGEYEITVQVSPAILKAVRPEYRQHFALGR